MSGRNVESENIAGGLVQEEKTVIGQLADKPSRGQSSRRLVNSPKCLIYNLPYIIALSVISDRLHYLYAVNIR